MIVNVMEVPLMRKDLMKMVSEKYKYLKYGKVQDIFEGRNISLIR